MVNQIGQTCVVFTLPGLDGCHCVSSRKGFWCTWAEIMFNTLAFCVAVLPFCTNSEADTGVTRQDIHMHTVKVHVYITITHSHVPLAKTKLWLQTQFCLGI